MVAVGKTRLLISLLARTLSVEKSVNVQLWKVSNSLVMATLTVKLRGLGDVRLTMVAVGKRPRMAEHTLLVLLMAVSAQMGSKAMESINVKMLMNARKGLHANARNATARTHGEAMSVAAVEACCT